MITSDVNRRYFSGMKSSAGTVLCFRDKAYLIIDFRYIEKARKSVTDCEVVLQESNLSKQILKLLESHNAKRVSVESHCMTLETFKHYEDSLYGIELDCSNALSKAILDTRMIKSCEEVKKIKEAQAIADETFSHILGFIREGVTEKEIALEMDYYMLKHGAEALSFDTIALAGKNTSMPHGVPSNYKVMDGDFVLMDFGAVVDGYHSDMTRTVCVGEPTPDMRKVYNIVLKAQMYALEHIKEGVLGCDGDGFARDIITREGYGECFGHSLGHGVGMEIHEYPVMSISNKEPLQSGSVVTVEPGIYIPDSFGVRIEDFVYVQGETVENLSHSPKTLICL
jgi:Xaa-Pro aminopeptidase